MSKEQLSEEPSASEAMAQPPAAWRRGGYVAWLAAIAAFALLHAWHLSADFPNHSPWISDWAKYTDEGWYGSAAIRAHLFGNWYTAGDFNPAVAVPVWPFLEWLLFFWTGVTVGAARGLAVACLFLNLALSCILLRSRPPSEGRTEASDSPPLWAAPLGITFVVTSPFLYCFSRLAILEPLETAFALGALCLALRLGKTRRPVWIAASAGLLFALAVLTKTTALFLFPAVLWAMAISLRARAKLALRWGLVLTGAAGAAYGAWMALIGRLGLFGEYKYYFLVNSYRKPPHFYWPLVSFWWSLHGLLWIDRSLVVLAVGIVVAAVLAWRSAWAQKLWRDPLFGASIWAVAGCVFFMTIQNHPQPRYFAVPAFFCFFVVVRGTAALKNQFRRLGRIVLILTAAIAVLHGAQTIRYAAHPEYTWVRAATELAQYMDTHPNGNRLLTSISGDEITLLAHVPSLCDDFGAIDLPHKLMRYQPGWYAAWNDLDPGTLEDLHSIYSLDQATSFRAFDDPERNRLVLFRLLLLPYGQVRHPGRQNLQVVLPDDRIEIPVQ